MYVSNLDLSLETHGLSRMFSVFGDVVSCKARERGSMAVQVTKHASV